MIAIELVEGGEANRPAPVLTAKVVQHAARLGLIVLSCGVRSNVIRLLPALTIEEETLKSGLELLNQSIQSAINAK